jgi:AraC family transcriptional regulator of adaptative response / DNA-3-methyladenine glycosylase II
VWTSEAGASSRALTARAPYDQAALLGFLAARALPGVERVEGEAWTRTVLASGRPAAVHVQWHAAGPRLTVRGAARSSLSDLEATARRVLDLDADPAALRRHFRSDPLLGPLVSRRPGLRIPGHWDPFECAVRAVLGQQVTVAAGRTFAARLVARAGPAVSLGPGLTHLFPGSAALAEVDLAGLGLTGSRAAALQALARAVRDGEVDFGRPSAEVVSALVRVRGIGPWTAQYVALRGLGDRDAFPAGDLVLRRMAAGGEGRLLSERELRERAEPWRPFRAYAVIHLWRAASALPAPA